MKTVDWSEDPLSATVALTPRYLLAQKADETRARKFQAAVPDRHREHAEVLPSYRQMPFSGVGTFI